MCFQHVTRTRTCGHIFYELKTCNIAFEQGFSKDQALACYKGYASWYRSSGNDHVRGQNLLKPLYIDDRPGRCSTCPLFWLPQKCGYTACKSQVSCDCRSHRKSTCVQENGACKYPKGGTDIEPNEFIIYRGTILYGHKTYEFVTDQTTGRSVNRSLLHYFDFKQAEWRSSIMEAELKLTPVQSDELRRSTALAPQLANESRPRARHAYPNATSSSAPFLPSSSGARGQMASSSQSQMQPYQVTATGPGYSDATPWVTTTQAPGPTSRTYQQALAQHIHEYMKQIHPEEGQ